MAGKVVKISFADAREIQDKSINKISKKRKFLYSVSLIIRQHDNLFAYH